MADLGTTLVDNQRIRIFDHAQQLNGVYGWAGKIGGALPVNGGPLGDDSYLTFSDRLPRFAWDGDHPDLGTGAFLDGKLAHELSHLLGDSRVPLLAGASGYKTERSILCGE